jgi:hypothetical protein
VTWHGWWWQWLILVAEAVVTLWRPSSKTRRRVWRGLSRFNEWTQEPVGGYPPRPVSLGIQGGGLRRNGVLATPFLRGDQTR